MGGAITALFAAENPDYVERLVFFGPAGFPVNVPWTAK
jgi:pimeloyl-ACP methyl ester carboxylesterase